MILRDYYRIDRNTAAREIAYYLDCKTEHVEEAIMRKGYIIVIRHKKQKPSFWFRLTLPLFLVFTIMAIVLMPVKYLITGEAAYSDGKGIGKLYAAWIRKLAF